MYDPSFNSVLVEIDDKDAQWGSGNNEEMLGKSYSKGTLKAVGLIIPTDQHPDIKDTPLKGLVSDSVLGYIGKQIMWNEGVEAGTTFEHEGKLYGFIYWWDIRGVLGDDNS